MIDRAIYLVLALGVAVGIYLGLGAIGSPDWMQWAWSGAFAVTAVFVALTGAEWD